MASCNSFAYLFFVACFLPLDANSMRHGSVSLTLLKPHIHRTGTNASVKFQVELEGDTLKVQLSSPVPEDEGEDATNYRSEPGDQGQRDYLSALLSLLLYENISLLCFKNE
jgi:hypothetical protein